MNINTNLSSLITQSSLKTSTLKLNQAIERMTTGCKINHAKDNAANYSISTNLSTKIGAYQVAEDNAMMGLDMIQTASSSLGTISDLLSRLRSMSIQAQNGTYGAKSLSALNSEAEALISEISRIRASTKYNGIELLAPKSPDLIPYEYTPNSDGFLVDVVKRDTSAMTTLASVDASTTLTSGTYSISTKEELIKLAEMTNNKLVASGVEFVLANDIDLGGKNWTPIGNNPSNSFKGIFDGNGYTVNNLYINANDRTYDLGLFGYAAGASIKNLGVKNATIKGGWKNMGVLIGGTGSSNTSEVSNCYTTGNIKECGEECVGGLIGDVWTSSCIVEDCYSDVDINISLSGANRDSVGGLIGSAGDSSIRRCFAKGNVYAPSYWHVGGLVGSGGRISDSYALGDVTGSRFVSGITGSHASYYVKNSYQTGKVNGDCFVGGICGANNTSLDILNCMVLGSISGNSNVNIFLGQGDDYQKGNINNCSYLGSKNPGLNLADTWMNCSNNTDLSKEIVMTEKTLQIGINSSEHSTLQISTGFAFNGLDTLLAQGLEKPETLKAIDELIAKVNEKQTELGAVENRLMSALESISVSYNNLVSTRSTIEDADIAEVSSDYIRQQILQQASATLMATANQSPAIALQLI